MHAVEIQTDQYGNKVAMAGYSKTPAWHVLGQVEDILTLKHTKLAGWDIQSSPVFVLVDGEMVAVDPKLGQVMTRKMLNGKRAPLSMVGKATVPHQNEDLFAFAEALLSIGVDTDNPLVFEAGGSLNEGRRVWVLFEVPGALTVGGDSFKRYVVVETSHDGKGATKAYVTYIRVVCLNTLTAASNAAANKYVIRHNGPIFPQMAVQAREVLGLHLKVDPVLTEIVSQWQDVKVTDSQVEQVFKAAVPDAPKTATDRQKNTVKRKRNMLTTVWKSDTVSEYRNTKWGVLNTLTEAYQWAPGSQTSAESLAKRQMVGAAANEREALRLIDAVLAS